MARSLPAPDDWPDISRVDVRLLVSTSAAATQELALEHTRQAMQLTEWLLARREVSGQHRDEQPSLALGALRDAYELLLGPVDT
jgi:hypothetical protein